MQTKLITLHPQNPQPRLIAEIIDTLKAGGVIIYPTDTRYALGCDIYNKSAVTRIAKIKGVEPEKALFSCICPDFKTIGNYTGQIDNNTFKIMKQAFPGPYTFILPASKNIPRHFQSRRKTLGVRVVDQPIASGIVAALEGPLTSATLPDAPNGLPILEPQDIFEAYKGQVDIVIDGGRGGDGLSTIIEVENGSTMTVVREGLGDLEALGIVLD
ncbi:MAG: L-threonylcarbamoyladenylate synthase [Bacteroidia bacterium]